MIRIATEGCDVVLDPLDGCYLIERAIVARGMMCRASGKLRMCEETKHTLTIVGRDGYDAMMSQRIACIAWLRTRATHQATTIEINEYWSLLCLYRSPDIEVEAILALGLAEEVHIAKEIWLHRIVTELSALADAFPSHGWLRFLPTQFTDWWCSKWYATIDNDVAFFLTFYDTCLCLSLGIGQLRC